MVRYRLLLTIGLFITLSLSSFQAADAASLDCGGGAPALGACDVSGVIHGDGVDIGGRKTNPGGAGNPGSNDNAGSGVGASNPPASAGAGVGEPAPCMVPSCRGELGAVGGDVSLDDVRHLLGSAGVAGMEPNGWAVVGTNTNFFSSASVLTRTTRLLDEKASVRFTPIAWHWSYGDGTAATLGSAGASWKAQNIEEFDRTPTSHVFRQRGTFTVTLQVEFSAEYKFADSGWILIDGTLTLPSNPLAVSAGDATTVLVGRDCTQTPAGPGC